MRIISMKDRLVWEEVKDCRFTVKWLYNSLDVDAFWSLLQR